MSDGDTTYRRALEENLWDLWSHFGLARDCALHDDGDALWFETPLSVLPYNAVLRFQVEEDADARIDALCDHFRRREVPFLWFVHPSARPLDLAERLCARGVQEVDACPGMVAELADLPGLADPADPAETPPTPEGFEIHEVESASDARDVLELVAWRWSLPDEAVPYLDRINQEFRLGTPEARVRVWVAWQAGVPVAKAVLNLAAGVAGLYGVATRPEARGRGLARALTLRAFRYARDQGFELGVLHSSPMAFPLYQRIGFREVTTFRLFASTALQL